MFYHPHLFPTTYTKPKKKKMKQKKTKSIKISIQLQHRPPLAAVSPIPPRNLERNCYMKMPDARVGV